MADSDIGVVITGKEIYDAVMATKETVQRVEERFNTLQATVNSHEESIEELKKQYFKVALLSGTIGATITTALPFILRLF